MEDNNDPKKEFISESKFRIWDYEIGHSQLLLRCPRSDQWNNSFNTDIIFVGVFYLGIPTDFHGIKIEAASPYKSEVVFKAIGWLPDCIQRRSGARKVFQITTLAGVFYLGAAGWHIKQNVLGPRETSLDFAPTSDSQDGL